MATITVEKIEDYLVLKIPLKAVKNGRAELSQKGQHIIDSAIAEGLADLEAGKIFGPFKSVKEFKETLAKV